MNSVDCLSWVNQILYRCPTGIPAYYSATIKLTTLPSYEVCANPNVLEGLLSLASSSFVIPRVKDSASRGQLNSFRPIHPPFGVTLYHTRRLWCAYMSGKLSSTVPNIFGRTLLALPPQLTFPLDSIVNRSRSLAVVSTP